MGIDEKFEGGAMLLFYNQFYIEGEYGVATLTPENAFRNGVYRSEGSYFRAGAGYLKQLDAKSRLGFGVMYAQSQFEDEGRVFSKSPSGVQSDFDKVFGGTGLSAEWVELVITSESRLSLLKGKPESKLNRLLALGFNFRLRFLQTYDSREPTEDVYAIPGYGRIVNNPNPALNLYLKVYLF